MRIAVTGVSGLVGGGVLARLAALHDIVTIGRQAGCHRLVDLTETDVVFGLDLSGIEAVVHCAGPVDEELKKSPEEAARSVLSTEALARAALRGGARHFVYVSTCHVYGPLTGAISECTPPDPRSEYAFAHFRAEEALRRVARDTHMRVLILRPCAVFGMPWNFQSFRRWHLIPYAFPASAVYGGEILLKTAGRQRRNFISTYDLAGLVEVSIGQNEGPQTEVVNPVGKETISIVDTARLCAAVAEPITGRPCKVSMAAQPLEETGADFEFATESIRWWATERLEDYFAQMIRLLVAERAAGRVYGPEGRL